MANRVQARHAAALDFQRLRLRAEAIASQARTLQTSKWGAEANAAKLERELLEFAQDVAAAAARAMAEVSGNAAIADDLFGQAQRLGQLAERTDRGPAAFDLAAQLRPLEVTLGQLHTRMQQETRIADEADRLARRAAELADGALTLRFGGRPSNALMASIHTALLGFAGEAGSIAVRIEGGFVSLQGAVASMASQTRHVAAVPSPQGLSWMHA